MFIENQPGKYWKRILFFLFLLITLPNSWISELSVNEAFHSCIAREMIKSREYFIAKYQDNPIHNSPMLSWIQSCLYNILPSNELTTRIPGILALALLSVLCGYMANSVSGPRACAASVSACISSFIAMHKGLFASQDMLFALFLNLAWLTWYFLSREKHLWLFAWFFAHTFVYLAFLTSGIVAIFYFYFPLIWLQRPLKTGLRLRQSDHIFSFSCFMIFIIIWILYAPFQKEGILTFFSEFKSREPTINYIAHFITFPILSAVNYLPWSLLAWPAFCMAFIPLEKDGILGKFLRTIIISIFYCLWFLPETKTDSLLPLIGPLSILTGIHYEILVRRYGKQLLILPKIISCATLVIIFVHLLSLFFIDFDFQKSSVLLLSASGCCIFIAVIISFCIIKGFFNTQIWLALLVAVINIRLVYTCTVDVTNSIYHNRKSKVGIMIKNNIPADKTVYNQLPDPAGFSVEYYYMKRFMVSIRNIGEIPNYDDIVYLLTSDSIPISQQRTWTALPLGLQGENQIERLWKGERKIIDISPRRLEFRYDVENQKFIVPQKTISLSHQLLHELILTNVSSEKQIVTVDFVNATVISAGDTVEFKVNVPDSMILDEELHDKLTFSFEINNKVVERSVQLLIKPQIPLQQ